MNEFETSSFGQINDRLKEIIDQVSDETIPLDNALDLFEEAVKLGVQASSLLEEDIVSRDATAEADAVDAASPTDAASADAGN